MLKLLTIGWKDLIVTFRDRAALIMMLAAPFVLTLGMGAVTGAFSDGSNNGIDPVPLVLVNEDEGELGGFLLDVMQSEELADLLVVQTAVSTETARQQVDDDAVAAAVLVPTGFSASIFPDRATGQTGATMPIEVYANPGRPIGASVVEAVVTEFVNRVERNQLTMQVTMTQLATNGLVEMDEMEETAVAIGNDLFGNSQDAAANIVIDTHTASGSSDGGFNVLSFFAPSMAIFFLMYTVTIGARSILQEQEQGTLSRLLVSPTSLAQVLGGKVVGTFLTGVAQVTILIVATTLLFQLRWGNGLGVALLIVAVALAATSWGLLVASLSNTPGQVGSAGTAVMLLFGILGGTFFPTAQMGGLLEAAGKITPHAWAMDGFLSLATGGTLADVVTPVLALLLMTALVFGAALLMLRRRWAVA
ncbi:MAG: ABC transporter permease [Ardenticatenaceae bacterium]|nr:ABC transporter permease [Ardenticatenaceae bacterium]